MRRMPKKKDPPEDPARQHERFKETARKIEADETGRAFERAFERAVPPKSTKKDG